MAFACIFEQQVNTFAKVGAEITAAHSYRDGERWVARKNERGVGEQQ